MAAPEEFPTSLGQIQPGVVVSLADAVASSLREAILSGKLKAGERILQDRLAADLGVSRQPVRDAIKRLQAEGLVTELRNRRLVVREYTRRDILENYLLRRLLEAEAAKIAARTISERDLSELVTLNRELQRATSLSEANRILELNQSFHRLLRYATGLPALVSTIDALWLGITIATPLSVPGRAQHSIEEHDDIIDAIRRRDSHGAEEAMSRHIDGACRDFLMTSGTSAVEPLEIHDHLFGEQLADSTK